MSSLCSLAMSHVAGAFSGLRRALDEAASPIERRILRDVIRDALDRDSATLSHEHRRIVAGTWVVTGEIHHGTHFLVERLRHRDLGSEHALKRITPDHSGNPLFRDVLLREAANHLRIRHPAVLPVHVLLRLEDGSPALIMDYMPGSSLAAALHETFLAPQQIYSLLIRLCDALNAIHGAGIVHGDLTPANILLPGGRPEDAVICDFGLSYAIGEVADGFEALGTAGFVAPEAASPDTTRDVRSDLFALGAVLSACLNAMPVVARAGELVHLGQRLCAENPAARPTSAATVQVWLEAIKSKL